MVTSWQLAGLLALAAISCQAFVLPSATTNNGAISGPINDRNGRDDGRLTGPLPAGVIFEEGMSASDSSAPSSAVSPRDWEETKRMLLEYLDQGGDPWEIPEVPRLILISELGLQRGSPTSRKESAYLSEGSPKDSVYRQYSALDDPQDDFQETKRKRDSTDAGPSLSVVNHLDVLRQKLLLEMARRRMQKSQSQIIANQNLLRQIGKRSVSDASRMEAHAHRN